MRPTLPVALAFCAGSLFTQPLFAQEETSAAQASRDAPALEPLDEELPQVTIVKRGDDTVTEFRLRGKLYMVQVTPLHGASYYLVDHEGRGQWIRDDSASKLTVPTWILTSW
jgi:hypothetical protein